MAMASSKKNLYKKMLMLHWETYWANEKSYEKTVLQLEGEAYGGSVVNKQYFSL